MEKVTLNQARQDVPSTTYADNGISGDRKLWSDKVEESEIARGHDVEDLFSISRSSGSYVWQEFNVGFGWRAGGNGGGLMAVILNLWRLFDGNDGYGRGEIDCGGSGGYGGCEIGGGRYGCGKIGGGGGGGYGGSSKMGW
ncbi:uncharacterized protein LOC132612035 [Lycium barbarum]|uniref:uncharacterized protein LOC132612035 n=1 Tax=Lycium barbarum TaxID=112863 RepID=UPI00293E335C|nr:uncharacterized protein LOC132612035 [Lycium barbarum]